jgi:hypothetical protein
VRGRLVAVVLCGAMVMEPISGARAVTCAAPVGSTRSFAGVSGRARLLWISGRLDADAAKARRWARWWGGGIGAAGVASLAAVPFVSAEDRVDWYAGAATAAVGVIPFVFSPLDVTRAAPELRAAIASGPSDDDPRFCAVLADAEGRLRESAANERWNRGWWIHAGNIAFNTAVLLFLGLGYGHWTSGVVNGVAGAAAGEAIIFTQPTGAIDAAAAYERGELTWPPLRAPRPALGFAQAFAF